MPPIPQYTKQSNTVLFRFLVFATVVFCVISAIMYWQQNKPTLVQTTNPETPVRFSNFSGLQDQVLLYQTGAKIISDIEAYPEIQEAFFSKPIESQEWLIPARLREVQAERLLRDDFAKSHVYHTSYYIGNLLARGNETLDSLLRSQARPETTRLIETALADVRAGSLSLQTYFDQATPAQYDPSLSGALYYTTPTFPSLTAVEVATVLYVLATLDPTSASLYEHSLHQFVNQLFASGAHFRIDIEYALTLAELYYKIMQTEPVYSELFQLAQTEWATSTYRAEPLRKVTPRFRIRNFPIPDTNAITVTNRGYEARTTTEVLDGHLRLSLLDLRIPNPVSRLYEYSFASDQLLPIGSELVRRQYPDLKPSVRDADYEGKTRYAFVTGEQDSVIGLEPLNPTPSQVLLRTDDLIEVVPGFSDRDVAHVSPQWNVEKDIFLVTEIPLLQQQSENTGVGNARIVSRQGNILMDIPRIKNARFVLGGAAVMFLRDNTIMLSGITATSSASLAVALPAYPSQALPGMEEGLEYAQDAQSALYYRTYVDSLTGEPSSEIYLYAVSINDTGTVSLQLTSEYSLKGYTVRGLALSPGGLYIAAPVTETLSQINPKVLIFDTINGIVKKDIPLTPFAIQMLHLDAWSLF